MGRWNKVWLVFLLPLLAVQWLYALYLKWHVLEELTLPVSGIRVVAKKSVGWIHLVPWLGALGFVDDSVDITMSDGKRTVWNNVDMVDDFPFESISSKRDGGGWVVEDSGGKVYATFPAGGN